MWGLCLLTCVFLALGVVYDAEGAGVWFTVVAAIVLFVAPLSQISSERVKTRRKAPEIRYQTRQKKGGVVS